MPEIQCKTLNNKKIKVSLDCLTQCGTFTEMKKTLKLEKNFIFYVEIKENIFRKVINWCKNHIGNFFKNAKNYFNSYIYTFIGIEVPFITNNELTHDRNWFIFSEYERNFFDALEIDKLTDILRAASYLDLQSLYIFGCQEMASRICNCTPEEIRDILQIKDDLSVNEKAEIQKSNIWCKY